MKKSYAIETAAAAVFILASLAAAGYAADFDGRGGAQLTVKEAVEKYVQVSVPEASKAYINQQPKFYPERQCYDIRQIDKDGPERFLWANFSSSYSQEICAPNNYGVEQCHWQTLSYHNARAEVTLHFRELKDGEAEVFTLCYDFVKKKGAYSINSPFVYDEKVRFLSDNRDGFALELTPLRRKPVAPDAAFLELQSFSYDQLSGEFTLKLGEKSDIAYWGTKVQVGVELVEDRMFDSSKGVKFFEFPINWNKPAPVITFKAADFGGDKDAGEDRAKTRKYFAKWGFKVISDVHTGDYLEKGRTETISVLQ
ncbi:MAG: hypothetical protein A2X31_01210 [Elusimicrobia bacterium GWB2_63_22]|nr:MAG: hypothetical protein A2X31_01210 [Elusimicrobia bacterium GWB2_63_22]